MQEFQLFWYGFMQNGERATHVKNIPFAGLMKHCVIPSLAMFSWVVEFVVHSLVLSLAMTSA